MNGLDLPPLEWMELLWLVERGVDLGGASPVHPEPPAPLPAEDARSSTPGVQVALPQPEGLGPTSVGSPEPVIERRARPPRPRRFQVGRLLDRALHRLGRRAPMGPPEVDVGESIERSARQRSAELVLRGSPVPIGTLVVLEDQGFAMEPFRETITALVDAARRGRRFARVVHLPLDLSDPARVQVGSGWREGDDAASVVLLLMDGRGPALRSGALGQWLRGCGAAHAWVHPWEPEGWARTGVAFPSDRPPPHGRGFPILPLTGPGLDALVPWAQGRGPGGLWGLRLPDGPPGQWRPPRPSFTSAKDLATVFALEAHPIAAGALGLAAGVPGRVDLELLRFLGEALSAGRIEAPHLAEALTCPLLTVSRDEGRPVASFCSVAARKAALRWLPRVDLPRILTRLVQFLEEPGHETAGLLLPPLSLLLCLRTGTAPPAASTLPRGVPGELRAWVQATGVKVHPGVQELLAGGGPDDALLRMLPERGWWTTFEDLARILGTSAARVRQQLADHTPSGFHRVIAEGGSGTKELRAEGVPLLDGGGPDPVHRLTPASLEGRKVGAGARKQLVLPGAVVVALRYVPAGRFWMGSEAGVGEEREHPLHEVILSRGYWLGETPVTQAQWAAVATAKLKERKAQFPGSDRPMESVSWDDAEAWLQALAAAVPEAAGARLPTEAEWERAARAGTDTPWSHGDDVRALRRRAWYGEDKTGLDRFAWYGEGSSGQAHPVGEKLANPWGLCDMHGNVWEWCADEWLRTYTPASVTDPRHGAARGGDRVMRGGCCWGDADGCRSAYRDRDDAGNRWRHRGFRLLLPAAAPPPMEP